MLFTVCSLRLWQLYIIMHVTLHNKTDMYIFHKLITKEYKNKLYLQILFVFNQIKNYLETL